MDESYKGEVNIEDLIEVDSNVSESKVTAPSETGIRVKPSAKHISHEAKTLELDYCLEDDHESSGHPIPLKIEVVMPASNADIQYHRNYDKTSDQTRKQKIAAESPGPSQQSTSDQILETVSRLKETAHGYGCDKSAGSSSTQKEAYIRSTKSGGSSVRTKRKSSRAKEQVPFQKGMMCPVVGCPLRLKLKFYNHRKIKRHWDLYHEALVYTICCPECEFMARRLTEVRRHLRLDHGRRDEQELDCLMSKTRKEWNVNKKYFPALGQACPMEVLVEDDMKDGEGEAQGAEVLPLPPHEHMVNQPIRKEIPMSCHSSLVSQSTTGSGHFYQTNWRKIWMTQAEDSNKKMDITIKQETQDAEMDLFIKQEQDAENAISDVLGEDNKMIINIETAVKKEMPVDDTFCYICNKSFSTKGNLVTHQRIHTGEKPFKCEICDKVFSKKQSLLSHQLTHSEVAGGKQEKPFKCEICAKKFTYRYSLARHQIIHTGEKPYKCEICDKACSQKGDLLRHQRSHTGEKPFECECCNKNFSDKRNLVQHEKIHKAEKACFCEICNKNFSDKRNLVIHQRTHTGEKPYICEICEKGFTQKRSLIVHHRTHTGEKPYKCEICEKGFTQKRSLIVHHRTHTGEKPYKCEICEKGFTQKRSLVIHHQTHTGEKPHICEICDQAFTQRGSLVIHRRRHTGEKPYKCEICGQRFTERGKLVRHTKRHKDKEAY